MAAPRVLTKCLAAKQQRNAVDASHGTVRHIRGSARTEADHDGQEGRQGAGGTPRLPGLTGVAGTRSWRDVSCGTGSGPCRVRRDGQRAARRVPNGWRARCRETRRGCRMRRQGNTRQSGNTAPRCGVRLPWRVPGSPSKTKHHRPRPLTRPRGATSPSRSEPCGRHCGARSPRLDLADCQQRSGRPARTPALASQPELTRPFGGGRCANCTSTCSRGGPAAARTPRTGAAPPIRETVCSAATRTTGGATIT